MGNNIAILGSTGSIGTQTLQVAKACGFVVSGLVAHSNIRLLEEQAREWLPKKVAVWDEKKAKDLAIRLADTTVEVVSGLEGVIEIATIAEVDTVVTAMVGISGLVPTLHAIEAKKRIALANKETLVCAGPLVMEKAKQAGVEIIPVDSEHSAIFQCLQGNQNKKEISRLLLTASGGPFFGCARDDLLDVTLEKALKHPNWSMGAKVTIDSATLMNKGLEFLEAMALFDVPPEKISVLVHRESIVHSLVEYCDNAVLAQLGTPDMKLPIQYALTYPMRVEGIGGKLDLLLHPNLHFASPDLETFPCLALAIESAKQGGTLPAIMNGANEIAVARFLNREIGFMDIPHIVEATMNGIAVNHEVSIKSVFDADREARVRASQEPARYLR